MSALPLKADIGTQPRDVRFVPKADVSLGDAALNSDDRDSNSMQSRRG